MRLDTRRPYGARLCRRVALLGRVICSAGEVGVDLLPILRLAREQELLVSLDPAELLVGYKPVVLCAYCCLPRLFSAAKCFALEACVVVWVVTVSQDPRPHEPVKGVLQAMSVLEEGTGYPYWALFARLTLTLTPPPRLYFLQVFESIGGSLKVGHLECLPGVESSIHYTSSHLNARLFLSRKPNQVERAAPKRSNEDGEVSKAEQGGDRAAGLLRRDVRESQEMAGTSEKAKKWQERLRKPGTTEMPQKAKKWKECPRKVQPARRLRTCVKAKKTYRGLDKESLVQSEVFSVERWSKPRENV
ncbi:hypothetical protein Taro_040148 [Colocasia esculenta]|uniref:Uncharacterized protein n=1 Tax=Colocasia esculenta TaxID=4460 RepID=A0A843WXN8_COLES|nr:hypothetical protein [Colocasia esculenta]